jgi:tRNA (guanine-N7-)-methyltransferase
VRGRSKPWAGPYLQSHPELVYPTLEGNDPFLSFAPIYLEIGMGKGDFILGLSKIQKGHYLGVEKVVDVLAVATKKLIEDGSEDILLRRGDFDDVYEEIKDLRFEKIYLNFSDPWPKRKHWRRRLTEAGRLTKMVSLLEKGGEIRFKSDNVDLYEYTLEQAALANLEIVYNTNDYALAEDDVMSEYEKNFRSQGVKITRVILKAKEEK